MPTLVWLDPLPVLPPGLLDPHVLGEAEKSALNWSLSLISKQLTWLSLKFPVCEMGMAIPLMVATKS